MRTDDAPLPVERLRELAQRASRMGAPVFTPFLTPPEQQLALGCGKAARVDVLAFGGYEDAERRMVCFSLEDTPFPLRALEVTWPHEQAPSHRDLLGSVMGLGLKRDRLGDIALEKERALVYAEEKAAALIERMWAQAGRTPIHVRLLDELPTVQPLKGREIGGTLVSLRLDAVLAEGLNLSRSRAAELISSGAVKLRHVPTLRPDAKVQQGDTISVRGEGRLKLTQVGQPTRKGRLPVQMMRYGEK